MKPENNKSQSPGSFVEVFPQVGNIGGRYSPAFILLITIIGAATAEIIAMIVVYFARHLPYYQQVIIDATVLVVIIFPLLYFLSFRPLLQHIRQRYQVEQIIQSRLRIIQYADSHTLNELLQFTLDELETLTGSTAGYFLFLEADQKTIGLKAWSTNTLKNLCNVKTANDHDSLNDAGVWADCVRLQKVVVHNDFASVPRRKELPEGHFHIVRDLAVPIKREDQIVAILGLGNKPEPYTQSDIELVSTLADFSWDIVKHKQAEIAILKSEDKFRTLVDWTFDWELWIDPQGIIIYTSPSCERVTGYRSDEFVADPDLLIQIVHPDDRPAYVEHHQLIHDESAGAMTIEYRLIGRGGSERWIEHVCRPLFGSDDRYLGRRVSNSDITERKRIEAEIQERNDKEKNLTQTLHTIQLDIARDLHDTIGQNISYLRMKLDYLAEKNNASSGADLQAEFSHMSRVANESYDLVRGTLAVLQSQNSGDLLELFKRYARQVVERSGLEIQFQEEGEAGFISSHQMRQLFYIFREALSNIEKHSGARQARVEVNWMPDGLTLCVEDDGRGFDASAALEAGGHYGLKFIRERVEMLNGSFQIKTQPGAGTHLIIGVPMRPRHYVS